MSDDLAKKILEWLNTQGYPFEMSVALQFQKAGCEVSLANFYTDYETKSQREIDVTAHRWSDFKKKAALQVCTRVECKSSKGKPWVIFISQAQPERIIPFQLLCSSGCRVFLLELFKQTESMKLMASAPLLNPVLLGHGLTQALKDQPDMAHEAIFSTVKASIDRVLQFDSPEMLHASTRGPLLSIIVFPAIAVDTRLFECYITEEGNPVIREVESSVLLWRGINPINGTALIPIITKPGIPAFVEQFTKTWQILFQLAEDNMDLFENAAKEARESILGRTKVTVI